MAFTYDISTDRGKVRLACGDTTDAGHLIEDAEIDYFLTLTSSIDGAAIRACRAILAKLSAVADRSVVGINTSRSQKFTQTKELLAVLEAGLISNGGGMTAYSGGASKSRNESIREDTDFNHPPFAVGQDSNPPSSAGDSDD